MRHEETTVILQIMPTQELMWACHEPHSREMREPKACCCPVVGFALVEKTYSDASSERFVELVIQGPDGTAEAEHTALLIWPNLRDVYSKSFGWVKEL